MTKFVKIAKWIVAVLLTAVLAVGILWYYLLMDNIVASVTVEIGEPITAEAFKRRDVDIEARFMTDMSPVDLTVPGEYPVTIAYFDRAYESTLCLVDTQAPVVETKDLRLFSAQYPKPEEFIASLDDETLVTITYVSAPDPKVMGHQQVRLRITDLGGNTTLADAGLELIFDENPPIIQGVRDLQVYVGFPVDIMEGITVSDDMDPNAILTVDQGGADLTKEGEYTITYTAMDLCGNTTVATAVMKVVHDTKGPKILGVNKLSMYEGSTISYRSGIVLEDDYDEAPVLQIDSSDVDMSRPGTYNVIYTATDAAGNVTRKETTITIKERMEGYVEESVIYDMADDILEKIITDGMSPEEQVRAIYKHVHAYGYVSTSDKTDRLQGAYRMMTKGQGDCYNFYALSSLLFERLGLPQIAVKRSDDSGRGSKHFWNMVSIDGGESYYHYDATPTTSFTDEVCLVTDATLDQLEQNAAGYFAMDSGVYPATPQTAP